MIVSAGYFSSRRAPSFQSSHETAVSAGIHTLHSSSPHMSVHRAMLIELADEVSPADQPVSSRGGEHSVRFR